MKKFLLMSAVAMTAATAMAIEPSIVDNAQVQAMSPDGKLIVSEWGGTISFFETATGDMVAGYGDAEMPYSYGLGSPFADDGTFVGATNFGAAYLKDDAWVELDVPSHEFESYAWGITPDGKMIVGIVGLAPLSTDDTAIPMQVPAYWERQEDGTYSTYHLLPYPEKDFTGRVPQYVTAMVVAEDNSIYGQVVDYSGSMIALIRYSLNAEKEWEYTVFNDILNPNHLQFPVLPPEPQWVNPESFMTEEEIAAYNEACNNWDWESGEEYPVYTDFMTDEEKAAYEAAVAAYNAENEIYMEAFNQLNDLLNQCQEEGKTMMFNKLLLGTNPNIVYSATPVIEEDPDSWLGFSETYFPMTIDAATGDAVRRNAADMVPTAVTSDGTMIGFVDTGYYREAVVLAPEAENYVSLQEYFSERRPEIVSWIEENMYHDITIYNWETEQQEVLPDCPTTGTPFTDKSFSVIATAVANVWDYEDPTEVYTYIFPTSPSGVKNVADNATSLAVKALKGGRLMINGEADDVTVYDLNGAKVYSAANPAAMVETGLAAGAYIVKVTSKTETTTLKVIF